MSGRTRTSLSEREAEIADRLVDAYDWRTPLSGGSEVEHAVVAYHPTINKRVASTLCGLGGYWYGLPSGQRCGNCLKRIYAVAARRAADTKPIDSPPTSG